MKSGKTQSVLGLILAAVFFYFYVGGSASPAGVSAGSGGNIASADDVVAGPMSASPVRQIIRGVISFQGSNYEVTQDFSPSIDPAKSVVLLSRSVERITSEPGSYYIPANDGACLLSLTESSITVAVAFNDAWPNLYPQRVSYQIIEYK